MNIAIRQQRNRSLAILVEGLIVKCAESSALRKAFPTMCGGLYLREEIELPSAKATGDVTATNLVEVIVPPPVDGVTQPTPATDNHSVGELEDFVLHECESDFTTFQRFGVESGNIPGADAMAGFVDIPASVVKRLLKSKAGLKQALQKLKEAA